MKIKVANRLRPMLSKHFVTKVLPGVTEPLPDNESATGEMVR